MQFKDLKVGDDFLSPININYQKTSDNTASHIGGGSFKFDSDEIVQLIKWQTIKCTRFNSHFKPVTYKSNKCPCGATFEIV